MPNVTTLLVLTAVIAIADTMVTGKAAKVKGNERNVKDSVHIPAHHGCFSATFSHFFKLKV